MKYAIVRIVLNLSYNIIILRKKTQTQQEKPFIGSGSKQHRRGEGKIIYIFSVVKMKVLSCDCLHNIINEG